MDASTIQYTAPEGYEKGDVVYCDVSIYQDGAINEGEYIEPTLTKRTKYIIKNAEECIQKIQKIKEDEDELEKFTYDFPALRKAKNHDGSVDAINKSLNFHMPSMPNNYFWENSDGTITQGNEFQFKVGQSGTYESFAYAWW